mmetsp:Transcript_20377/g.38132  ORF Transcript_20377/g.38132 Transcript_20377/m.38132 type:complete len:271 (+) Transcript_20377:2625-3437(+)|eukprot:CAMPEP_0204899482 /NCGR_PEP_ID=MMETSP1397-20131031/1882_1 /ASSEMBLY_ACC=CAM_ASM_000891 /TAXON_ID=49980 /ORGANISM="Climacostomum Climacostomum virens, Strain Stock W-24" /LENGTH=270 /DNA_ID=CAMNT_0052067449 /DNA_START=549 /DNA_END=1361 /DNA_ORIENTATION=+
MDDLTAHVGIPIVESLSCSSYSSDSEEYKTGLHSLHFAHEMDLGQMGFSNKLQKSEFSLTDETEVSVETKGLFKPHMALGGDKLIHNVTSADELVKKEKQQAVQASSLVSGKLEETEYSKCQPDCKAEELQLEVNTVRVVSGAKSTKAEIVMEVLHETNALAGEASAAHVQSPDELPSPIKKSSLKSRSFVEASPTISKKSVRIQGSPDVQSEASKIMETRKLRYSNDEFTNSNEVLTPASTKSEGKSIQKKDGKDIGSAPSVCSSCQLI